MFIVHNKTQHGCLWIGSFLDHSLPISDPYCFCLAREWSSAKTFHGFTFQKAVDSILIFCFRKELKPLLSDESRSPQSLLGSCTLVGQECGKGLPEFLSDGT